MPERTDQELVQAAIRGDTSALQELFSAYTGPLYRFILRVCQDAAVAEDLVQDTCVKAWRKLSTFEQHRSFKPWIFTIARNTCFDYLKKKKVLTFSELDEPSEDGNAFEDQIIDDRPLPHELLEREDWKELLEKALSTLPPQTRSTILLHNGEELTFQEIADAFKEPLNTVKSRYRRALLQLRATLTTLIKDR